MKSQSKIYARLPSPKELVLRPVTEVMNLERLGSLHPYRLSFMRILIRRVMNEAWSITQSLFDIDEQGHGTAVYETKTPNGLFSFVIFSHDLDPKLRTDRVIAEQWDMTATLCEGKVSPEFLEQLRKNVPLQEKGRLTTKSIVMTRANKSSRNFDYVVKQLTEGRQPQTYALARVGYLYRTTAVYGSGKFGMADWDKVRNSYADFASPFAAEMFTCFMIRQFSIDQVEHIARSTAPDKATRIAPQIARYLGIGNATGLGMAPYLINHPLVVERWIAVREAALARVLANYIPDEESRLLLGQLINKAALHMLEVSTDNEKQNQRNQMASRELDSSAIYLKNTLFTRWSSFIDHAQSFWGFETQEVLNSLLMELYPEATDGLEQHLCVEEVFSTQAHEPIAKLMKQMRERYQWALKIDSSAPQQNAIFWYRSEEKMEPRLGVSQSDEGRDKSMNMGIGIAIKDCYEHLCDCIAHYPDFRVAQFLLLYPTQRGIVKRIQTMLNTHYGEIQANLHHENVAPTDLMRCKLSFFGVSKFDPRSKLWVRNTMFQGAPTVDDIGKPFKDDWFFPVMPHIH